MYYVLKAELCRLRHHRGIMAFFCIAFILYAADATIKAIYTVNQEPQRAVDSFRESLAFPSFIYTAFSSSFMFVLFLGPGIVATIVGQDYQSDTWKTLVPRLSDRRMVMIAKTISAILAITLLITLGLIVMGVGGFISSTILSTPFTYWPESDAIRSFGEGITEFTAFFAWYLSAGVLLVIISRSAMIGAFAMLAFYFICVFIRMYSPEYLAIFFAPSHFTNLAPLIQSDVVLSGRNRLNFPWQLSWLVVGIHVIGQIVTGVTIFKRQDFD